MGESSIEWTATVLADGTILPGYTFNPWEGCEKISPGCKACYAAERDAHWHRGKHWGALAPRYFHTDQYWRKPIKWNREVEESGVRRRVFCASLADVFEDREDLKEERWRLFKLIDETPGLDWLLLTKRPENMVRLAAEAWGTGPWAPNVWAGTTTEDQEHADKRIPILLEVPAVLHFISYEPALGPVVLREEWLRAPCANPSHQVLDWVIAGGESGRRPRPMDEAWVRAVRDQCDDAGTHFFYKQRVEGRNVISLPVLDGRQHVAFPEGGHV